MEFILGAFVLFIGTVLGAAITRISNSKEEF